MNTEENESIGQYRIEDLKVGMQASYSHTIKESDVKSFAELSGDKNPVHTDEEYAKHSRFRRRIAHGLYSASFFSALFGTRLPGAGCVYVSQNLRFNLPVYIDDVVVAEVTVTSIDLEMRRVFFDTTCYVKKRVVIQGDAEIYMPKHARF